MVFRFLSVIAGFILLSIPALAEGPGPLEGRFFGNQNGKILVVALHGDLRNGSTADYQHGIANRIAKANRNVIAFGMIRAGYSDKSGLRSPGSNNGRRDHYTSGNNKRVADTIAKLKKATGATRVVAIGHSGGAAQLGSVIGRFPGLVDVAVLVSCPCDIARWRKMRGRSAWAKSQSPSRYVKKVSTNTRVIAITGSKDNNTYPVLAKAYVAALQKRGVSASFISVNGAGHGYKGALSRAAEKAVNSAIRNF